MPPPERDRPGSNRTILIVVAAVVIVAAAAGGVAVALSGGGGGHGTSTSPTTPIHTTTTTKTTQTTQTTTTTNVVQVQQQVVTVLLTYTKAISRHDATLLGTLLAPGVTRRGAGYGSAHCTVSDGKSAVLALYEDQFTRTPGGYRFTDLSPGAISVTNGTAAAHLHYLFSADGATGPIAFTLEHIGAHWQISHISATCNP